MLIFVRNEIVLQSIYFWINDPVAEGFTTARCAMIPCKKIREIGVTYGDESLIVF